MGTAPMIAHGYLRLITVATKVLAIPEGGALFAASGFWGVVAAKVTFVVLFIRTLVRELKF